MNKILSILLLLLLPLLIVTACKDEDIDTLLSTTTDKQSEYWHTRTLTRAQQEELKHSFGLGFSFEAVYGSKCDMGSIRCQVLNNSSADSEIVYWDTSTGVKDTTSVTHSFAEYCQATNVTSNLSGDVLIYSADYSKVAAIYEHGMDTTVNFYNSRTFKVMRGLILDIADINETIKEDPEKYLSPSFLYAMEKLKKTSINDVVVVDSFIDIFGTHVICDATIGARLTLDVKSRKSDIHDYKSEETITEQQLNLLFVKKNSTLTETEQSFIRQLLNNSQMDLNVKGGNTALFHSLIINPYPSNIDATEETLNKWAASISMTGKTSGNVKLVDMNVAPIWEFIPDNETAARVKARIIATAPTMQQLFGNRNFVSCKFRLDLASIVTWMAKNTKEQIYSPWVYNIIAANRHVATVCKEWVPEISTSESVTVVYPIYENKVDLTAGLCIHKNTVYRVSWRYDRFIVKKDSSVPSGDIYLTFGCLSTRPTEGISYQNVNYIIGYEWPGSIVAGNGAVESSGWLTTRKFLGDFYLENNKKYINLPNWTFTEKASKNDYYQKQLEGDTPYRLSGISINGKKGMENIGNRMTRNSNYTYYINTNEAWYEKK